MPTSRTIAGFQVDVGKLRRSSLPDHDFLELQDLRPTEFNPGLGWRRSILSSPMSVADVAIDQISCARTLLLARRSRTSGTRQVLSRNLLCGSRREDGKQSHQKQSILQNHRLINPAQPDSPPVNRRADDINATIAIAGWRRRKSQSAPILFDVH